MSRETAAATGAPPLQIAGVLVILGAMVLRVTSSFDPFPGWSGDPFRLPSPILGITPLLSLGLDVVTLLGAALALAWGRSGRSTWVLLGLVAAGGAAAAWHSRPAGPDALEHLVLGSAWIAALVGAIGVRHAAADAFVRRIVVGCVLGVVPVLVFKAVVQVYIDHPETVREYAISKRDFLESQGWTEGSPMALAYERRLMQAEGSGWFGLANVYASLVAAGCVALAGLAWAAWRSRERAAMVVLAVSAGLGGFGVALAGSKGGFAAAGIGIGLLAVLATVRRWGPRAGGVVGALVVVGALGAVVARGWVGERIGELSLLFRWFYMQAAARVFAENPLWGVGPAGFKDGYMRLKNPISPEDVASPHSVLFDYAATLGVGGLCLGAAWVMLVVSAGRRGAGVAAGVEEPGSVRAETRACAGVGAVGIIGAAWLEQAVATVDSTLLRLAGLAAFAGVAWGVARVMRGGARAAVGVALAAGALALAAHCQIEMTAVAPGAALWVMLAIAVAGGARAAGGGEAERRRRSLAAIVPMGACGLLLVGVAPAWRWEMGMRGAYANAAPIAEFNQRAQMVFGGRPQGDTAAAIARELGEMLGESVQPTASSIAPALDRLRRGMMPAAITELRASNAAQPGHFATSRALARLCLLCAESVPPGAGGDAERGRLLDEATVLSRAAAERWAGGSSAWAWLATTLEVAGRIDPKRADAGAVIAALRHAAELAPYEPGYQVKLAMAYDGLADPDAAKERARCAARALELDRELRLDPLRRMPDSERAVMERFAGGGR